MTGQKSEQQITKVRTPPHTRKEYFGSFHQIPVLLCRIQLSQVHPRGMNVIIRSEVKLTGNGRSIRPLPLDQDAFRKQHRSMIRRRQYFGGDLFLTVLGVCRGSGVGELVVQFDSQFTPTPPLAEISIPVLWASSVDSPVVTPVLSVLDLLICPAVPLVQEPSTRQTIALLAVQKGLLMSRRLRASVSS
ncbi:uncharacterized protein KD926_001311 [Aspergillus affinis]|uniref:uncharacterized protein n=1 Tax=Aspergillus affinis TaxID=1070780 RepID=UPI0022FE0E19|nr:uncharacterized protein KD926_001311 [Aspergillus affinis]KAI9036789.1 hypothetical protein KD926_001311 [Aspergillus affinis]